MATEIIKHKPFVPGVSLGSLKKNFLRRFFNQTSLPKKSTGGAEHSRAVTSDYFREGRLIAILRLSRQVEIQGLFEPTRQLRSSSCSPPWSAVGCHYS